MLAGDPVGNYALASHSLTGSMTRAAGGKYTFKFDWAVWTLAETADGRLADPTNPTLSFDLVVDGSGFVCGLTAGGGAYKWTRTGDAPAPAPQAPRPTMRDHLNNDIDRVRAVYTGASQISAEVHGGYVDNPGLVHGHMHSTQGFIIFALPEGFLKMVRGDTKECRHSKDVGYTDPSTLNQQIVTAAWDSGNCIHTGGPGGGYAVRSVSLLAPGTFLRLSKWERQQYILCLGGEQLETFLQTVPSHARPLYQSETALVVDQWGQQGHYPLKEGWDTDVPAAPWPTRERWVGVYQPPRSLIEEQHLGNLYSHPRAWLLPGQDSYAELGADPSSAPRLLGDRHGAVLQNSEYLNHFFMLLGRPRCFYGGFVADQQQATSFPRAKLIPVTHFSGNDMYTNTGKPES